MIKVEVKEYFTLQKFDEIKNLVRKNPAKNEKGYLYDGDTFECSKEMADYLLGNNPLKKTVVDLIEIIPEKVIEVKTEKKSQKRSKKEK